VEYDRIKHLSDITISIAQTDRNALCLLAHADVQQQHVSQKIWGRWSRPLKFMVMYNHKNMPVP